VIELVTVSVKKKVVGFEGGTVVLLSVRIFWLSNKVVSLIKPVFAFLYGRGLEATGVLFHKESNSVETGPGGFFF
jgi:hypothetical protein